MIDTHTLRQLMVGTRIKVFIDVRYSTDKSTTIGEFYSYSEDSLIIHRDINNIVGVNDQPLRAFIPLDKILLIEEI